MGCRGEIRGSGRALKRPNLKRHRAGKIAGHGH